MDRTEQACVYRATTEAWVGQLLLPVVFFALLTLTAVHAAGLNPWVGGVGLAVLVLIVALDYLLPMIRNYLHVDTRSIDGSLNGRYFQVYWTEILAAWIYENRRRRFLCIGTREGTVVIPLRFFDEKAIWTRVRGEVPPDALSEDAIHKLPDYQEWEAARAQALEQAGAVTVTDHWLLQVVGWAGLTFFLFGAIDALRDGRVPQAALFALLTAFSITVLASWGVTEFSPEAVERYTLFGGWKICWEDVRSIEIDPLDSVLVLCGEEGQLAIPGPGVWGGANKKGALAVILSQAEKRQIELHRNPWAVFKLSRNTRVRR